MTRTRSDPRCEGVKRIHRRRRKRGICIGNARHGEAYRGGRCKPCWEQKLARERDAYAARKESEHA